MRWWLRPRSLDQSLMTHLKVVVVVLVFKALMSSCGVLEGGGGGLHPAGAHIPKKKLENNHKN